MNTWNEEKESENIEDNRMSENLKKALASFAKNENREKLDENSAKLKYTAIQQYHKVNQLLLNSQIRGHWEWDLKRFIDKCDRKTQEKLACGNYLDIKTLKINMRKSEHVHYLNEDWKYIATLLTVESLKEIVHTNSSPWAVEVKWSDEAKELREVAVRSPKKVIYILR